MLVIVILHSCHPQLKGWLFFCLNATNIIAELYQSKELDDCLNRVVESSSRADFKQELFLILLESPEKVEQANRSGSLMYYVVRIILNLSSQTRNVFHRKYKDPKIVYDTEKALYSSRPPSDEDPFEARKERERMEAAYMDELERLDDVLKPSKSEFPYYQGIVELLKKYGTMRAVARETGIPKSSISDTVKRIRNHLNDNVR